MNVAASDRLRAVLAWLGGRAGGTWRPLSTAGLLAGTLAFALSLTPSLLPRTEVSQGVISGLAMALGYAAAVLGRQIWAWLGLPPPFAGRRQTVRWAATVGCLVVAASFLWRAIGWQNAVRRLMGLGPVAGVRPLRVFGIALLVFLALLAAARLFRHVVRFLSGRLRGLVPARVSQAAALVTACVLFWGLIDGVIFAAILRAADRSFQAFDARIEPEFAKPDDPHRSGGTESLIRWRDTGRQGRRFIASGPTPEDLARVGPGAEVVAPVRVYVGIHSAESPQARAALALEELRRADGFRRSVLVIITPTGTGWVDPKAIDTLEILHRGDVASVAVQYSYLPSALSLMAEGADRGAESSQAVFREVYGHWAGLPRDRRPDLYLHGVSLGAMHSDLSFDLHDIIADPFRGALWSGPPFRSRTWRAATARRDPDSPAWLPRVGDGEVVRFANQETGLDAASPAWGPFRIAFLQYASDPITFYERRALYRRPDWMREPRGPDVSPDLRWVPVVTWLQLAADMVTGTSPVGHGHSYAPGDYLDAWRILTEPPGWTEQDWTRLRDIVETGWAESAAR